MNDQVRASIEEARKLTPEERLELLDLLGRPPSQTKATAAGGGRSRVAEGCRVAYGKGERGETAPVAYEEAMARARQRIR